MDYLLDNTHHQYIRIQVSGAIAKKQILNAMKDLVTHPEYEAKHSLWDFSRAEQGSLGILDIKEIVGFLRLYKPRGKTFANKSAIMVSSQFHMGIVNVFISMSKILPFKYQVFTKFEEAVKFLSDNG